MQIPFLLFTFVLSIKTKIMKNTKDLNYYKNNCEEDYIKTPISVLRYITELEQALQLPQTDVSISLERAKKYARHQHYLGTQGKQLVEFEDKLKQYVTDKGYNQNEFRLFKNMLEEAVGFHATIVLLKHYC